MIHQLELTGCGERPLVDAASVRWLEEMLEGEGWLTASEVLKLAGLPITENNRRWVRELANHSDGRIASGPGTPGYALTRALPPDEIGRIETLKHQATEMLRRYTAIFRVWHAKKKIESDNPTPPSN
jgi:hypothetical protein